MNDFYPKIKKVVIREDLVELTGHYISALILNQFLYWTDRVNDFDMLLAEELERKPDIELQPKAGWIYKKAEELNEELMINASVPTIRKYIKLLIEKGYLLERTNPKDRWDKVLQYRVDVLKIQIDLFRIGYFLEGYKLSKPLFSRIKNILLRSEEILLRDKESLLRSENSLLEYNSSTEITTETTAERERENPPSDAADNNNSLSQNLNIFWQVFPTKRNGSHPRKTEADELLKALTPAEIQQRIKAAKFYRDSRTENDIRDDVVFSAVNWLKKRTWRDHYAGALAAEQETAAKAADLARQQEREKETAKAKAAQAERDRQRREAFKIALDEMQDDERNRLKQNTLAKIEAENKLVFNRLRKKTDIFSDSFAIETALGIWEQGRGGDFPHNSAQ